MTTRRLVPLVLPWLLIIAIGVLSAWLRYGFIEPPALAHRCDDGNAPLWCGARQFIVIGFNTYGFGIAALIVTVLSLLLKKPWIAWLAAALGVLALTLYCYYAGAVALLVGCLRLLRLQANAAMTTPGHPHGHGDGKVQTQP
ncbi:hypothetical protein DWU98_17795 [Dyella monticola]|uniref:Uncharacterized protein n=1 Tax=Dyella monticola TaxID=1927958 RepID=A0A370WTR8_9GAMM|nr:hypothetical protein [Dyella monticola]RDS79416.1 hypothetical protein DWU98_17795 [Dyella monticola]